MKSEHILILALAGWFVYSKKDELLKSLGTNLISPSAGTAALNAAATAAMLPANATVAAGNALSQGIQESVGDLKTAIASGIGTVLGAVAPQTATASTMSEAKYEAVKSAQSAGLGTSMATAAASVAGYNYSKGGIQQIGTTLYNPYGVSKNVIRANKTA